MTRRDYEAIAMAMFQARMDVPVIESAFVLDYASTYTGIDVAVEKLADMLAIDNKSFDRQRFVMACITGVLR